MILSIDIGTRNMGVCVLQPGAHALGQDDIIRHWRVFEIPKPVSAEVLCDALREPLEEWDFETVVVERQPGKSVVMQRLQHYCEMLFHTKGKTVAVMEAKNKLVFASNTPWWPPGVSTAKWTYYNRKMAAVKTVRKFLADTNSAFLHFYEQSSKRDDLADSLLQAMAHAHFFSALDPAGQQQELKARKPTPRQLQKGKLNTGHIYYILKEAQAASSDDVLALAAQHPAFKGVLSTRFANDPIQMLKRFNLYEEKMTDDQAACVLLDLPRI